MITVDLDLAQVRAFAAAADHLHFGRAARSLSLTQQGLSKRIARLEDALGARLFDRTGAQVGLTPAGRRFLDPARAALAAGSAAVDAVRQGESPIRVDLWGHLFEPLRTVRAALDDTGGPPAEVGPGRDLPGVAAALLRGEVGAAFGRFHPLEDGLHRALAHRPVRFEPVDAVLPARHPLACAPQLRPADLAGLRLLLPAAAGRLDFLGAFAARFGIPVEPGGTNLGLDHLLARVRADGDGFALLPAELPFGPVPGTVVVPLADPTPLYAWSLVWHRDRPHPGVPALLDAFAAAGRRRRWLEYRPGRDWLPEAEELAAEPAD
ncbi:LysR family transcriptional regulator [Kitasatospora sp. DSM 101779]|uniref:LysR family transcriptional regulator n=1 Tax=Kitasatospora sp. DSM 101779 TaxID=2853165 RepID=UPI0021D9EB53|nr:LysR family transcriptional regulator [Kitasatospora sp. DSM 101779]MCU7826637.1 LysR family transcriptional regulator [Kitasatospora sp. DSM 101779]